MHICDLHCDTALALYRQKESLKHSPCMVSLDKTAAYEKYIQLAAVFTEPTLDDEAGWQQFLAVREYFLRQCRMCHVPLCASGEALQDAVSGEGKKTAFLLTVEDARILAGKPDRLETLSRLDVSVITPMWSGLNCLGGAHNTDAGLTDFGCWIVENCFRLGIAVDLSHASIVSADQIMTLAEKQNAKGLVLASHSNAYALCPHSRNLTDDQIQRISALEGIIGLNLYTAFLTTDNGCTIDDVCRHIDHLARAAGEEHVAFGADWDGADVPADLCDISRMPSLLSPLAEMGYNKRFTDRLFYENGRRFLINLKNSKRK